MIRFTPKQCWEGVRNEYCQQYPHLYVQRCDHWFRTNGTPCVYGTSPQFHMANRWEDLKFNRQACDRIWYDKESGENLMKIMPWQVYTNISDVLSVTDGKCRRSFDYKYMEFESFW